MTKTKKKKSSPKPATRKSGARKKIVVDTGKKLFDTASESTIVETSDSPEQSVDDLLNVKQGHEKGKSVPATKHDWKE